MASSPSIGDSVASSDGSLSERLMGKWSKWSGTVPLLPPDSPVMVRVIALDRLVCIYRRLSLMLVCTPHGIIGIVLSQFWIWRAHANGAPAGTLYFDRMSMLRGWLVKAQQLRRGMKLANICGLIMILIKFSLLVVMLVAFKVKKEVRDMASSNLFAMFIVFIVIALTTLLDFAHFVAGALFVSPAVIRFLDAATPTIETSLLTDGEIETLRVACNTANLAADELGMERFMGAPNELMTGKAIEAVKGLHSFLCVPELELLKGLVEGVAAIIREVNAVGDPALTRALHVYGLCEQGSTRLEDLVKHPRARAAELREAHVVAIRLYTCAPGFPFFNEPLRDRQRVRAKQPHPLAVTTAFVADAVRRLRLEFAAGPPTPGGGGKKVLYRGLRGIRLGCEFMEGQGGGTELALMSTTSSWQVAVSFLLQRPNDSIPLPASESIVLRIVVSNAVQYGADVEWLSVNPAEHEVLFPPLCYLQPTGRFEMVHVEGTQLRVVEVVPFV